MDGDSEPLATSVEKVIKGRDCMMSGFLFTMRPQLLRAKQEIKLLRTVLEDIRNLQKLALMSLNHEDKYVAIQQLVGEESKTNQETVNQFNIASV